MRRLTLLIISLFLASQLFAQERNFDSLFPGISAEIRSLVFSNNGYITTTSKPDVNKLQGIQNSDLKNLISTNVMNKNPSVLVEALQVISIKGTLLDVYNALGQIRDLKGRLYHSHTRNENIPLFEDATLIDSVKKNNPIPDPKPAVTIPNSETVYIRLKDVNFGTSFYRGNYFINQFGLMCTLSNCKNLNYYLIPVIKEEKFIAQMYFEPIQEGILIYSIAGADTSDFISSKVDMPSAIRKRLEVIISWAIDGLKRISG